MSIRKSTLDLRSNLKKLWDQATGQASSQATSQTVSQPQSKTQSLIQSSPKYAYRSQPQPAARTTTQTTTRTTTQPAAQAVYTPADNSGNNYAALSGMSAAHQAALDAAKKSWTEASARGDRAAMDAAHRKAESIRALYDYSGGADGSEYIAKARQEPTPTPSFTHEPAPTFTYEPAPTFTPEPEPEPVYVNRYQGLIDELRGRVLEQDPFAYDAEQDPLFQQYRSSYTRSGERAMQDTLGQMAARTGGMASSYAGSAAQQSYDGYMTALAGRIPELQQLAYEMYQDEGDKQRLNLEMISALEREDYGKYQDLLGQYNTDRSFRYDQYRDQLAQYNTDRSFQYGQYRDQIADQRYADETAYNRGIYADETAYNRGVHADETAYNRGIYADETAYNRGIYADERDYDLRLQRAKQLAEGGDFSGYLALGYSEEEVQRLQAAYLRQHPELSYLYRTDYNMRPWGY